MALLFAAALLAAVLPPPAATSAAERRLTVTITDEKDAAVEGLALSDVAVLENGVARPVTELAHDARPLTVVLLVDTSEPMASIYRAYLLEPIVQFLMRLPEGSRFAVWTTGDRPRKLVDFTSDAGRAAAALRRTPAVGGNTLLDAVVEAARDLGDEEGRRTAMVIVTGLGPGFTNYDRQRVVEEGLKPKPLVLAVQFDEGRRILDPTRRDPDEVGAFEYEYVLDRLTELSGGQRETTLTPMGVAPALQKLSGTLRGRYQLRYEPLPQGKEGDRKLEVKVARPGVKVRLSSSRD